MAALGSTPLFIGYLLCAFACLRAVLEQLVRASSVSPTMLASLFSTGRLWQNERLHMTDTTIKAEPASAFGKRDS